MLPDPVVAIAQLNHFFSEGTLRKQVLYDINLVLAPGEVTIVRGPSGSGKTTLLTLMAGIRTVQEGSLRVFGRELSGKNGVRPSDIRCYIGYIFQGHNLLEFLTARQNVQMSIELHDDPQAQEKSMAMLQAVGLGERVDYYPQQLSGGEKQRVAIARALVSHPRLILADEPTAALDGKTGRSVVELMKRLAKEQDCAVLMVTHDQRVLDVADRLLRLEDGRLTAE
jgi:putative ABC transport system ATP-binding protein